jgi:hypothetical protein
MSLYNIRKTDTQEVVAEPDCLEVARHTLNDLTGDPAAALANPGEEVGGYWIEEF